MVVCPLDCIWRESPPSWLEKHEGWTITMVGLASGFLGVLLTYFLKSRCTKIKCCGLGCDREPLPAEAVEATAEPAPVQPEP